jgi:hypothetical protein
MRRGIQSLQRKAVQVAVKSKVGSIALSIDAAQVANATEIFTSVAHGLTTADRILVAEDGTLPTGITAIQYWIIIVDEDSFQLATTRANALAGTAVTISDDGTGANSYDLVEEIDGLDKQHVELKATAVGTYQLTLDQDAVLQDIVVVANSVAADKAVTIHSISGNVVTIKVNDIDETAALSDGFFHVLINGSEVADRS